MVAGENEVEQMQCVMEIMGPPPAALMERATRKEQFFEADGSVRITANKAGLRRFPGSKDLGQALRCNDGPFLSFLQVGLLPIRRDFEGSSRLLDETVHNQQGF